MRKLFVFFTGMMLFLFLQQTQAQQWNLSGNSVSPQPQSFLGTLNTEPLRFKTNMLQRMIISPHSGFVGIGVNNPKNPLHVHANDHRSNYAEFKYEILPVPEQKPGVPEPDICTRAGSNGTTGDLPVSEAETEATRGNSYSAIQITNCVTGEGANNGLLLSMENNTGYLRQLERANFNISMQNIDVVTVTPQWNVGIGIIPQAKLHVNGGGLFNGNVAIGTTSPTQKLHVVDGNILISRSATGSPPGCENGMIMFGSNNVAVYPGEIYGEWGIEYLNSAANGYGLNFSKIWNLSPKPGFNYALFLHDEGNVGIGTKDPQRKLDVNGDIETKGLFVSHTATGDYSFASLIKVNRDLTKAFVIENTTTEQTIFNIWGNGIVNAKKIYAEEFEITPNAMNISWYDHVFNQDYNLMSLSELEQFIKTNKHLPEILTEKEVKENGINLGEMQGKLLLKIEELTLYIIEQEKQMKEMQKQIDELKQMKGGK